MTTTIDQTKCTWCEENEPTHRGYDEHNGSWTLCDECHADVVETGGAL